MRFGGFGFDRQFGFSAAPQEDSGPAPGPPPELFPDPTLADVADSTDGWQFSNGFPTFGPEGGTGPGIQAVACFDDDSTTLVGADDTAFAGALGSGSSFDVAITFANVTVSTDITVTLLEGTSVTFTPANGIVTHSVTKGAGAQSFLISCSVAGGTFDITNISVKAV